MSDSNLSPLNMFQNIRDGILKKITPLQAAGLFLVIVLIHIANFFVSFDGSLYLYLRALWQLLHDFIKRPQYLTVLGPFFFTLYAMPRTITEVVRLSNIFGSLILKSNIPFVDYLWLVKLRYTIYFYLILVVVLIP